MPLPDCTDLSLAFTRSPSLRTCTEACKSDTLFLQMEKNGKHKCDDMCREYRFLHRSAAISKQRRYLSYQEIKTKSAVGLILSTSIICSSHGHWVIVQESAGWYQTMNCWACKTSLPWLYPCTIFQSIHSMWISQA